MTLHRTLRRPERRGFTMIELVVVILIILVLAALLLPAVMRGYITAGKVKQVDDMGKLTAGLDAFKQRYGVYPPSRVRLREGTPYNMNEGFDAHSVKVLKQIWPSFNPVTVNGTAGDPNTTELATPAMDSRRYLWCCDTPGKETGARSNWDGIYELEGDECLVFFLGGIAQFDRSDTSANATIILHGFTKRANDPSGIPNAALPATLTRDLPLVEFEARRLTIRRGDDQIQAPPSGALNASSGVLDRGHAFPNATTTRYLQTTPANTPKLPSYLALGPSAREDQRPWVYFSAYDVNGGYGYRPDDCNLPQTVGNAWFESYDPGSAPSTVAGQRFQIKYLGTTTSGGTTNYRNAVSAFPNPYTESFPYGPDSSATVASTLSNGTAVRWHQPNRYQLISPGSDGRYGPGGQIPRAAVGTDSSPDVTFVDLGNNGASFDNISNVSGSAVLGDFNNAQQQR